MTAPALKPGKAGYWIGALLILAGVVSALVIAIGSLIAVSKTVDDFARLRIPDDAACRLIFTKPGKYTVYYEFEGSTPARDDECKETGREVTTSAEPTKPPGLTIELQGVDNETIRAVPSRGGDMSISVSGHTGVEIATIDIPRAGDYFVNVTDGGSDAFIVAFGRGGIAKLGKYIGLSIALGLLGLILGLIAILRTRSRRKKAKAALAVETQAPTGWGAQPAGWPSGVPAQPAGTWSPQPPPGNWAGTPQPTNPQPTNPWSPQAPPAPSPGGPASPSPWAPPPPPPPAG
jgi:hypothetical protein